MANRSGKGGHGCPFAKGHSETPQSCQHSTNFNFYHVIARNLHKRDEEEDKTKSSRPPSKTSASKTPTTTMTDSGITHTIPNDNQVTVTMHTTVVQGIPSSTSSSSSLPPPTNETSTEPTSSLPTESSAVPSATDPTADTNGSSGGGVPTGAVVGIAIGGAVLVVILGLLIAVWRRRRSGKGTQYSDSTHQDTRISQDAALGEKEYPWPWPLPNTKRASQQPAGLGRSSSDPFGPFGGRADKPFDPYRPPLNTFEMDGVGPAVAELPASAPETAQQELNTEKQGNDEHQEQSAPAKDPRATLSNLRNEDGRPAYVNQWNQYAALAAQGNEATRGAGFKTV